MIILPSAILPLITLLLSLSLPDLDNLLGSKLQQFFESLLVCIFRRIDQQSFKYLSQKIHILLVFEPNYLRVILHLLLGAC
jgi:hypothetical protein